MQILRSPWLAVVLGMIAYGGTTLVVLNPKRLAVKPPTKQHDAEEKLEKIEPSWSFKNPELDQLLTEVAQERESLRTRERDLQELETRLKAERQEIGAITQQVNRLQVELDQTISRIKEEEAVNLKRLAKVYATMSPEGAAKILQEMQDDQIVKILTLMKETETAPLLENLAKANTVAARRAAQLCDRLRLASAKPPPGRPSSP